MRWVILTDDAVPQRGGIATWTRWATAALASAHEVRVFARHRPGLDPGVRGVRGPSHGRNGPLTTALVAWPAIRRADAVLCTTWPYARFVRRFFPGKPLHVVAHGAEVTEGHTDLTRAWRDLAGRWAVSDHLVRTLAGRGVRARRLPIPLPTAPRAAGGDRWLYVARATERKGGDRFIALAAAAGRTAEVVGEGPALALWKRRASELGADVRFRGGLDRSEVYAAMDRAELVFLLPRTRPDGSGAEGLGLVLLEARARGIPVVGCRTGGVPEAVGPGLLLDDPDAIPASVAQIQAWLPNASAGDVHAQHHPRAFLEALCG